MRLRNPFYSIAPVTVITLAAILSVILALLSTLLVLSQPWIGVEFDHAYEGAGVRVSAIKDDGRIGLVLHPGDVITALILPTEERVEVSKNTLLEDPDMLASYAQYNAFFKHQQSVFEVLDSTAFKVLLDDGRQVEVSTQRFPTLFVLPASFWWLIFFGGASFLLGISAWSMRPQDPVTRVLAVSGAGYMIGAYSCAIYAYREIALPADLFYILASTNHLGIYVFAYASILFFWYYPHRFGKAPAAWFYLAGVAGIWINETLQLLSWPIHPFYAHFVLAYCLLIGLSVLQWRKTKDMPLQRGALKWLMVTILLSLGATIILFYLPVILTGAPIASNVLTFSAVFLFYLGLVIGNIRYRQYNMDQWWLLAGQWLMLILIMMIADALFIFFLQITRATSLGLSIGVGIIYLLARQGLWNWLSSLSKPATKAKLPQLADLIGRHRQGTATDEQWNQLIVRMFNPLRIDRLALPCADISHGENENVLHVPTLDGTQTIAVQYCEQGKRLFTDSDISLATRFLELMRQIQDAAVIHEQGVQEERARIKRDLHDDVAASLLSLMHQTREPDIRNVAQNALRGLRDVLDRIGTEPMSLSDMAQNIEAATREQLSGLGVKLEWCSTDQWPEITLSSKFHINVRRIVRETIANALKHAHPANVIVQMELTGRELHLRISHDGAVVDPATWIPGRGINNIRMRVFEMGASHKWVIEEAGGSKQYCQLTLCVPLA